jgi:uracil-DNA glycosylase
MKWENFKHHFHETWHEAIRPFIESEECDEIYKFLKSESQKGKTIAPLAMNTYRCFQETRLDELRVIIMGMCPYHTLYEGSPVADGLLMGCSTSGKLQPTLSQFYDGIEDELYNGLNLNMIKHPGMEYLANQGVLMFNAALTVEIGKAGAHQKVWEPFVKYLYENIFNKMDIPTIFLGKEAAKYEIYVKNPSMCFPVSHPASASYKGTKWNTEGVFKSVGDIVWEREQDSILWVDVDLPF